MSLAVLLYIPAPSPAYWTVEVGSPVPSIGVQIWGHVLSPAPHTLPLPHTLGGWVLVMGVSGLGVRGNFHSQHNQRNESHLKSKFHPVILLVQSTFDSKFPYFLSFRHMAIVRFSSHCDYVRQVN